MQSEGTGASGWASPARAVQPLLRLHWPIAGALPRLTLPPTPLQGLPEDAEEVDLMKLFEPVPGVVALRVVRDRHTQKCRGFGYLVSCVFVSLCLLGPRRVPCCCAIHFLLAAC